MGVIKKKPYEISVWEDRLITEGDTSYYQEIKLAVIGSDKMESPNRVFDPVLVENVNGEKTLTFSLTYKYYDEFEGELVTNPFYDYLINERKIKLFYNDEWNEFVIKECEEDSKENIFNYTAKELFSLELAKLGYNVTLDTELNNNQGTVIELAKKVLKDTDWEVDEENSDILTQYVQEPLYKATINLPEGEQTLKVLNLDTKELVDIDNNEIIYFFYSYIKNKTVDNVQFIRENDRPFEIDDDNVITSTNYRFVSPVEYTIDATGEVTDTNIAILDSLYTNNQGYRLVYKIRTTYDPIMDRTVEIYQIPYQDSAQEIYHFLDYNYTTSDIVVSYITNGSDFNLYEDGNLQGWYNTTLTSSSSGVPVLQSIRTTTYPELAKKANLELLDDLSKLNGYIELKFNNTLTNKYENTYFNEGFEHSASIIDHISAGEKFALRIRYYISNTQHGSLTTNIPGSDGGLRVIVAKYETVEQECYLNDEAKTKGQTSTIKAYKILPNDIVLDFNGSYERSVNLINNGTFNSEKTQYIVDDVIQTPSMAYVYKAVDDDMEYVWDYNNKKYINKASAGGLPFADYYITTTTAKQSFTNEQMTDPKLKLGVFLYIKDTNLVNKYIYLQDIQLTRYYEDANGVPVTVGSAPTATSQEAHKYYLKPTTQLSEKEINTYGTLDALADELGADVSTITPVYNEESEKILSIQASQSNYFNILQDLCEKFECWLDIRVSHEEDGSITLDENFNPIKRVAFKEYAGKDNFAGFRNGVNLQGITRNIDSNEIVTKLIVEPVQSDYSDTGSVDIQRAKTNPSGQSYILNFSYYLNRGLITETREEFNEGLNKYYSEFSRLNNDIIKKQDELVQISNSLTKINAERNTYTALIDEAERSYNKAITEFQKLTGWEYEAFITEYHNIEEWARKEPDKAKNYLENDTVLDIVGQIYIAKITINNYTGILTNLDKSYQDLDLKLNGAKEYNISTTFIPGDGGEINPSIKIAVDDYVSGLKFELWSIVNNERNSVVYITTPNDRIFQAYNSNPYKNISILNLPNHYQLEYYDNNETYILNKEQIGRSFNIYDNITGETYNRRFTLVPDSEWAEEHKGLQEEIDELIEQKNQLEKEFYKKYSRFLQEGTWSSQDYIDPELYYFDALQVSDTSAQPKVSYTIDVLEVSQIEGFELYDFRVGDKTYIEDPDFFGYIYQATDVRETINKDENSSKRAPVNGDTIYENDVPVIVTARSPVREEVIVSEIEWHFDEPDNNTITIQNYKTRFEDLFQRISATVQTVQRNEITYPKTSSILDQSGLINSTLLANSLNGIGGVGFALTTNGSVQATNDGLLIRDLLNPANVMRLASSGLQVSTDGGTNWGTAINAEGISTDVLTAGTINTQHIWLMDGDNPSFRWDKSGLNAYGFDEEGNESYDLKTYVRFDKYGLYGIKNDEDYVASSLEDVKNKAHFGVTWDSFFIKNSYTNGRVEITSDDDFKVIKTDENDVDHERIKIGAVEHDATGAPIRYGINIRNDNDEVVFDTGDDGNVTMTGTINAQAGNFQGVVTVGASDDSNKPSIIIDGESNNPTISSSNYSDGAGTGWIIDSNGDATFSNVSVRGAIKTAVFEYEEIQAIGGAFLFRPSSTIKSARYVPLDEPTEEVDGDETYNSDYYIYQYALTEDEHRDENKTYYRKIEGTETYERVESPIDAELPQYYERVKKIYNDLIVTVDKPLMFTTGNWVKISNYNSMDIEPSAAISDYGLVHIYEIGNIDSTSTITIEYDSVVSDDLILIDFKEVENPSGNPFEQDFYEKNEDDAYVLTQDTEVQQEKKYYESIESKQNPKNLQLYEDDGQGGYQLTQDETPIENKTYYSQIQIVLPPTNEIVLLGGCGILDNINIENVEGGALIDFGAYNQDEETGKDIPGAHNYGIGINSSDNYVNLPARAISLFETTIHPNATSKVTYGYRGILGTLPILPYGNDDEALVSELYHQNMERTQGIYTDNMYIGDKNSYLAFYTDKNTQEKKLRITGADIIFTYNDGQGSITEQSLDDKIDTIAKDGGSLLAGHFLYYSKENSASQLTHPSANIVQNVEDDPADWGYNTNIGAGGIKLRNGETDLLSLTDSGLNIYHDGKIVASYGETIVLGTKDKDDKLIDGIEITNGEIGFYSDGEKTTYVNNNKLFIPYSVVLNEMVVGSKETDDYIPTQDERVINGKKYYTIENNNYIEVLSPTGNPKVLGYYEKKTTDLWAWKVTETDHLRLVWKGGERN